MNRVLQIRQRLSVSRAGVRLSRSRAGNVMVFVFLLLIGAFMALPMVYAILQSLKPFDELFAYPPRFFVRNPTIDNFKVAFRLAENMTVPFSRYVFNSLMVTVIGTGLYVIIAALAAYPLAKTRVPGVTFLSNIVVWALLFRTEVTEIPRYVVLAGLGIINTYLAVLLPAMAGSFGVFLMRQFIVSSIPDSLLEAARIDGAGEHRIFWRIVMPCVRPAWLTLIIFTFQSIWNATGTQYIYDERIKMLPAVLSQITAGGITRVGAASAVAVLLMIPPIVIFLVSQNSVMDTMAHSGIK